MQLISSFTVLSETWSLSFSATTFSTGLLPHVSRWLLEICYVCIPGSRKEGPKNSISSVELVELEWLLSRSEDTVAWFWDWGFSHTYPLALQLYCDIYKIEFYIDSVVIWLWRERGKLAIYVKLSVEFLWFVWVIISFHVLCSLSILITWYSETCYCTLVNFGGYENLSLVYGLISLCCWKWESRTSVYSLYSTCCFEGL